MKIYRGPLAASAALALTLSACGGSTGSSSGGASGSSEADCGTDEVFCVGMVTDAGKVDDKSFNQSAWEGIETAAEKTDALVKYIETTDSKDYAANIAKFTDKDYDVVVTVGFLMQDATAEAAAEYPDTHFIGVDQAQAETIENLTGLVFPEDQAGYAAGYLAGLMTTSNKVGQVLGSEIPPVQRFALGFTAGAKASNPQVSVSQVYHPADPNAFADPVWGANESKKQLSQGADVIFGAGGKTGNGALGEIAKASGAGDSVFCIGVDTDQYETVPEARPCLVTSAMKLIDEGVAELITQAKDGSIKGGDFVGDVGLAPYHDLDGKVPEETKTKVTDVVKGLQDGSIKTSVSLS
ncbi:MAG: BMP family ABC transporter substrate-binding protein [Micrococcales bacterium]|nr:MAG: BMP family ABC transporter substrate-binding protein [Micrococcales bacterium]